jgi:hypothetical protein
MMPAPLRAIPTRDRSRVLLVKTAWLHTIPADDLPRRIGLYTDLRDRKAQRDAKGRVVLDNDPAVIRAKKE